MIGRTWIYCWYEQNGKRGNESQHTRDRTFKLYEDGRYFNVVEDFQQKHPIDVESLSGKHRSSYSVLKAALDEQLAVTKKATELLKSRKPAGNRKGSTRKAAP